MASCPETGRGGLTTIRVPVAWPSRDIHEGVRVRLEPLMVSRHARDLFEAGREGEAAPHIWDYLPYGPFADLAAMTDWLENCACSADPMFFAIIDKLDGRACGMCSWLRITPAHAVIEIGHIWFARRLQRTAAATEALFLLFTEAMDGLGYRRIEWKCNAANEGSRQAALRFGFTFEGVFRQHLVVKGRNRDTAWFSIIDSEWPERREAFRQWLDAGNFDENGRQRQPLSSFMPKPGSPSG
ncbi:MAG: GNAT family N-acetyltransferase [Geminicoccaceae bacterium]|nr:GNAT family N-acetyltransferase [Geminicoccaceae bacterium]